MIELTPEELNSIKQIHDLLSKLHENQGKNKEELIQRFELQDKHITRLTTVLEGDDKMSQPGLAKRVSVQEESMEDLKKDILIIKNNLKYIIRFLSVITGGFGFIAKLIWDLFFKQNAK